MKVMFWNVRGLGRGSRRSLVRNHIISDNLEVVALQETIKQNFEDWELRELAGNQSFSWCWSPSKGHSGGMMIGIRSDSLEVEDHIYEAYFMGVLVRNRVTNHRFWIINVYGPAQHNYSSSFLQDLSSFCSTLSLPVLMGGDFNLIRNNNERNQGVGDQKLMDLFNEFIGSFQLREIFCNGSRFTWSNKQKNPILVKLDRILASTSWELHYPTCFAWVKPRVGSDHCPLVLNTGEEGEKRPRYFFL
jgi:exonuclease III